MKHIIVAAALAVITPAAVTAQRVNIADFPALPADHAQARVVKDVLAHAFQGNQSALESALKEHAGAELAAPGVLSEGVSALLALKKADAELEVVDFAGPNPGTVVARLKRGGGRGPAIVLFRFESGESTKIAEVIAPLPGEPIRRTGD